MKNLLKVTKVVKNENMIRYQYEASEEIMRYVKGELYCQYDNNIENIPDSIAVIPFISNVLPFIWLTNSTVEVEELDKEFYECVTEVKAGYKEMYPMLAWKGEVKANKIVDNSADKTEKEAIQLFSGGVDAFTTFFRHIDEKPDLITVWGGGDININDTIGWSNVSAHTKEVANRYGVYCYFIKSNFLEFLNIDNLNKLVISSGDSWWHGFQHALALLGLSAPISHNYKHLYIASSYPEYLKGKYTLASDPTIDNHVRFKNCRVTHDGYEWDRQEKVKFLVEKKKQDGHDISLRVCWESDGGDNCCKCEKCYRTILEIISEGGNPNEYGFKWSNDDIKRCKRDMKIKIRIFHDNDILFWRGIVDRMKYQKSIGAVGSEYDWFNEMDFDNFNNFPMKKLYHFPLIRKIRHIPNKIASIKNRKH